MKTTISLLFAVALFLAIPSSANAVENIDLGYNHSSFDGFDVEIIRHTVYITQPDVNDDEVSITREYELFINDEPVKLTDDQRLLVKDYYDGLTYIYDKAKTIGWEGAKIGIEGAKIGLYALAAVGKMLLTSYTEEEMEADIEAEAQKIEARAEVLEEKAEELEKVAEELEEIFEDMLIAIPELQELDW